MSPNQSLQEKYPHLEVSVLKLSEVREDNESFRIDSEYFKKEYLENEKKLRNNKMLFEISNTYELHSNGAFKDIYNIIHDNNPKNIGYIESKNIGECFIDGEVDKISEVAHSLLPKTITKEGDILTARTGKIGGASYVFKEWENCNTNQNVVNIRLFDDTFSRVFVALFLNTKFGLLQFEKASTGNVQPWLNLTLLRKIKIPIFPMSFQLEIEKMVKDSHKALQESKALYKKAEETLCLELGLDPKNPLQSLLDSHTQDSAKPLNISIRTLKESFLQTGRLDSEYYQAKFSKNEEIIKSGTYKALSELVRVKKSIEPGSSYYKESGIPFVRVSNLSKFGLGNSDIYLDSKDFKDGELESLYPKKDTILLSKDGSVGIAYCVSEDLECVSSGAILHLTIIDSNVLPQYLTLMLNSIFVKLQAERDCGGSIIEHWRIEEIEKVLIPILPFKIQENIEMLIKKSFELKEVSSKLLQEAKAKVESAITTRE